MKKTAIICADWIAMVDIMDDATAGRLLKQMLSIMNEKDEQDPEDLKFVLAHIRKFWADQDESYSRAIEQRRQAALSRWHKSDANNASASERIQVNAKQCITDTDTVTDNNTDTRNNINLSSTTSSSVERKKTKKIPVINHYSSEFESFWWSYPKRKGKARAWEARLRCIDWWLEPSYLISKASDYAKECSLKHVEDQFIKRPQGWLNDARYDDDFFTGSKSVDLDAISDGLDSVFSD